MKKTSLVIIAIVVIILLLGAWFFIFNKKSSEIGQPTTTSTGSQKAEEQTKAGIKESLLGLMEGATGVKCTVEDVNGKYVVTTKDGKARIDGMSFPSQQNPAVMEAGSMINDGEWAYIWNGEEGMKFNLKDMDQAGDQDTAQQEKNYDWKAWAKSMETAGAKYDCSPTVATSGDFLPPSDVKFQDLGELMKSIRQMQNNPGAPIDPNQFRVPY